MPTASAVTKVSVAALFVLGSAGAGYGAVQAAAPRVPAPVITSGPAHVTNALTARFAFTDARRRVTFQCSRDGSRFANCTSGKVYFGLRAGKHVFAVRARTAAGTTSRAATYFWLIDRTPPEAPRLTGKPANPSNATSAAFAFTGSERRLTFQCQLDGHGYRDCTSPKTFRNLGEGRHTVKVRAVDAVGNTGAAVSHTWTVIAPVTAFGLSGDVTGLLRPGASVPVNVTITNPYGYPIKVGSIAVWPRAATTRYGRPNPGCDGSVNLTMTHQFTGTPIIVAARDTRSLSQLGVPSAHWPTLTMPNLPVNQDACKATAFAFDYTGTANEVTK